MTLIQQGVKKYISKKTSILINFNNQLDQFIQIMSLKN